MTRAWRRGAAIGPAEGPSRLQRRPRTRPSTRWLAATTVAPSRSLALMTAPGDRVDDVLADPVLEHGDVEVVAGSVDGHSAAEVGDPLEGDPPRGDVRVQRQPAAHCHDPAAQAPGQSRAECLRAGQQGRHVPAAVEATLELD